MRSRFHFVRHTIASVAALLVFSSIAAAQDKETLWTKVTAEGRIVSLAWDKDHPWDAALNTGGAELVARYFVDSRREVSESLGRGVARNGDRRTLRFPLPETLRAPAVGPVCLFLQLPDRRTLPVRRANARDADTVGFRYEPWERQIRQASEAKLAQERVAVTERSLSMSSQNIAAKQTSLAQRGWTDMASCEQIATPSATVGPRPPDVVAPADQDNVARQVCVNRVAVGYLINDDFISDTLPKIIASAEAAKDAEKARSSMSEVYSSAFAGPPGMNPAALLNAIVGKLGADNATVRARQSQGTEFLRDWAKWTPTLKNYTPPLGSPTDDVGWPSTAAESAFHLFGHDLASQLKADWAMDGVPAGTVRDLESYLGAALDAYSGCVEDSAKQLKTKYDSWEGLRSTAPQRAASARDFLTRECRQEVGSLDGLKSQRAALQDQLTRDRQSLTAATASSALPTASQQLNSVACGAKQ